MPGRQLTSANLAHVDSGHTHPVLMGNFQFDVPIYVHTGLGTISYDGNDYLGIGALAGISGVEETENIVPSPVRLQLNGLDESLTALALDAATYGSRVSLMLGYRDDEGALIDTPWTFYKGRVENSNLVRGGENSINVTVQHDLAILKRKIGTKYTDEEQQRRYPGDLAFDAVEQTERVAKTLTWGTKKIEVGPGRPQHLPREINIP